MSSLQAKKDACEYFFEPREEGRGGVLFFRHPAGRSGSTLAPTHTVESLASAAVYYVSGAIYESLKAALSIDQSPRFWSFFSTAKRNLIDRFCSASVLTPFHLTIHHWKRKCDLVGFTEVMCGSIKSLFYVGISLLVLCWWYSTTWCCD